ncbi:MAG TPA: nitroreductase family protein [Dehalococcoidia bacterium]|nr:nitroreductase family protein [Dehalococcoidia bacterium]
MDVMQAIKGRRSVRKYKPDPVSDTTVEMVLEAARWAPSWANTQCWRFVVVRDPQMRDKLAATLKPETNRAAAAIREAPVTIVACAEKGRAGYYKGEVSTDKGDWFMFDVALAMQNLTLAAYAAGLGTVHVGLFDAREAAIILEVPDNVVVVEMMPLGYPDQEPTAPPRKELAEIMFKEKYGSK